MINRLIFYLSLCSLSGIALTDPVDAQESMPNIVLFLWMTWAGGIWAVMAIRS